jgi:dTDP-4-dehydrorhamnose 3,5-epimerase
MNAAYVAHGPRSMAPRRSRLRLAGLVASGLPMSDLHRSRTPIEDAFLLESSAERDDRGSVGELLRREWVPGVDFVQWNVVQSVPRAMRGAHWHERHHDLIAPVAGTVLVGLADLRPDSPTHRRTALLELDAENPAAVVVPPRVAHALYSLTATTLLYAVSRYWDREDEFGVAFDDPELGVPWPCTRQDVILSERDRELPRLAELAVVG